ncbi:MAG: metalloregulator ArsR/SmtB family transcription factor [Nitrospinota bacterium]|nr:metalloregulator ArsR/SmtB family transcription factor [Nitrospinota bacterium]
MSQNAVECMDLLRALSDENRQKIIMLFAKHKELCANDIASRFTLSRPAVSHHLNLMKRAGALKARKDGKEIYYSFNKPYVIDLLKSLIKSMESCC